MVMVTLLFRDWGVLAAVISTATLVTYTGPTTVMSLREMGPKLHRPFRGTMLKVMAPLSLYLLH